MRPHLTGSLIVNGGISPADGARLIANGSADALPSAGCSSPIPTFRSAYEGAGLNEFAYDTAYGGGPHGYTDDLTLQGR